ncbi:MAG: 30S ribosomal protein S7 [Planctomycetota bacterium]|nr:30S ribosomal protein S7 [Planctomycetota bacterium]
MPRKYTSLKYLLRPDPKYNDKLIGRFINNIMKEGKKTTAQKIFYHALEEVEKKITNVNPVEAFNKALNNVKPIMEVKSKRVGGATYQVPTSVSQDRQMCLAIRWILEAVRKKKGRPFYLKLSDELISAYKNEGDAIVKKQNVHKMAEANRAFAHFGMRR